MAKQTYACPEMRRVIDKALRSGCWHIEGGGSHGKLRHTSGRMVVFGGTISDHRAIANFQRDIRHVEAGLPGRGMPNVIANVDLKAKKREKTLTF